MSAQPSSNTSVQRDGAAQGSSHTAAAPRSASTHDAANSAGNIDHAYRDELNKDSWQTSAIDNDHPATTTGKEDVSASAPPAPLPSPVPTPASANTPRDEPSHHNHHALDHDRASSMAAPDSARRKLGQHPAFKLSEPDSAVTGATALDARSEKASTPSREGQPSSRDSLSQPRPHSEKSRSAHHSSSNGSAPRPADADGKTELGGHRDKKSPTPSRLKRALFTLGLDKAPRQIAWIPSVLTWPKLKPVFRSAIIAWICMVLMLIKQSEIALGTASFLVLISAFIQTADLPFVAVMEREFFSLLMACGAWVYTLIPISIAHAVRRNKLSAAETIPASVYQAQYLEARPAIVCAFFLSIGSAFFLYVKVRFGPGPFLFGSIFSCILLNISLTYAPLYPYPVYTFGRAIAVPLAVKSAITFIVYAVFFPKSQNSLFVDQLIGILRPLQKAAEGQVELFERSPLDSEFDFGLVRTLLNQAEAGLMPLAMSSRLITREISFGRASGEDLKALESMTRALVTPADGWSFYFSSIKADLETAHFPKTPLPSRLATPAMTPAGTPRGSHETPRHRSSHSALAPPEDHSRMAEAHSSAVSMRHLDEKPSVAPGEERLSSRFRRMHSGLHISSRSSSPRRWFQNHEHSHLHGHNSHHHGLFHNLVQRHETVRVAMWESIRFGNIETHLHTSDNNPTTELFAHLILESSRELLLANAESLGYLIDWLETLNRHRLTMLRDRFTRSRTSLMLEGEKRAMETAHHVEKLERALADFKVDRRFRVLEPYRNALGEAGVGLDDMAEDLDLRVGPGEISKIHHRYLYQAWLHQFHTMSFSRRLLALLHSFERIDRERPAARLWAPSWFRIFHLDAWRDIGTPTSGDELEEEDPESVPAMDHERRRSGSSGSNGTTAVDGEGANPSNPALDLGDTRRRDPDALDPQGPLQVLGQKLYFAVARLFQGHLLFAVKAAALIALVSLPAFMRSSAAWCYENRAIWAIFMAQLTLARFRGETAFALFSRLIATFTGACVGLVIWYISTGSGRGNAYGLGATTAVAFPVLMMFRLYYPGPPITTIITTVTVMLIVGYSWKDVTNPSPGSPGFGWTVAWKRFVTVAIGVTAAYLFSYLPPSNSLRKHQRLSHATTIAELGRSYCSVVAVAAASPRGPDEEQQTDRINKRLISLRAKLRRLDMASVNVSYEYSLRGKWPKERYAELFKVQMELLKLLSHTLTVISQLGPAYNLALLRRTRFLDPLFLGDVISVISMCSTALKTASPLPQITPCPLLDRFLLFEHGFDVRYSSEARPSAAAVDEEGEEGELMRSLPRKISLATLKEEEYMAFAVGVVTLFGLVVRIDRLCVDVKELVGESFHVPADVHRTMVVRGHEWSKRSW